MNHAGSTGQCHHVENYLVLQAASLQGWLALTNLALEHQKQLK